MPSRNYHTNVINLGLLCLNLIGKQLTKKLLFVALFTAYIKYCTVIVGLLGHFIHSSHHHLYKSWWKKGQKSTAPGIPKRSPIQVLTEPDVALLRGSDENRCIQRGMAVDIKTLSFLLYLYNNYTSWFSFCHDADMKNSSSHRTHFVCYFL